ncbi:MAG: hypothetical protein K8V75_02195 [Methanobrevibacter woesei]|nr:hypothetical protein [Methanobrevibacter woesei]
MKQNENILKGVINKETSLDDSYLFEQYKLYVNMANDVSNRRESTNKFYISIISAIISVTSYITIYYNTIPIFLLIIIIIISILWEAHINEYRQLNKAKFEVINHIENYLPAKGYTKEWELLMKEGYKGLTKKDEKIPKYLGTVCIVLIIALIINEANSFL